MYDSMYEPPPGGGVTPADLAAAIATAEGYTDIQVGAAISTAEGYTDIQIAALNTFTATSSEYLAAGNLVNVEPATNIVRLADWQTVTREAFGFVLAAAVPGGPVTVHYAGVDTALTGLVTGDTYYVGSAGAVTNVAPITSGYGSQQVGYAISTTALVFQPRDMIGII